MAFLRAITNKTLVSKTKNKKLITCPAHKRARCNFFTLCFGRIRSRVTHSHTHTWTHTQKHIQLFILSHRSTSFFIFAVFFIFVLRAWASVKQAQQWRFCLFSDLQGYLEWVWVWVLVLVLVWVGVSVFSVVLVCMHKWATALCVFAAHYWNSKLCMARYSCCCCCGCCLRKTNAHKFTISA